MEQDIKEVETNTMDEAVNSEMPMDNPEASSIFNTVLSNFPKWTYTTIEEVSTSEEDDYIYVMVGMKLEDDMIEKYQNELKQNGFTGSWQIMSKNVGGKEHKIDFSFVQDQFINYYIFK